MDKETEKLLEDYDKFTQELMSEINNLCQKLQQGEQSGWEGSRRRGVYQPFELEKLRKRLQSALYKY